MYSNNKIPEITIPDGVSSRLVDAPQQQKIKSKRCKAKKSGKKIIIFQRLEYIIGGIETWGYNLAKVFKDKNITFVFGDADKEQVERLSEFANVIIDNGENEYKCDVFISANYDGNAEILSRVKAKKYYQTIHSDFKKMLDRKEWRRFKLDVDSRYKIIAVSEDAKNGAKYHGYDSIVARNPLAPADTRKRLVLLSMTRMSEEKGLWRMIAMAEELKAHNIPFTWVLCSTIDRLRDRKMASKFTDMQEVIVIPPSPRNEQLYQIADYTVQLSDTEAYCYTIRQSLQHKVPVIATKFNEAMKIIKDGENGYLLDFDLSNMDVEKFTEIPKITEEYTEEIDPNWARILDGEDVE